VAVMAVLGDVFWNFLRCCHGSSLRLHAERFQSGYIPGLSTLACDIPCAKLLVPESMSG
jgi:hypothetical protein